MPVTVRGVSASLRWGYYLAASLGAWAVTHPDGDGPWTLTATVESLDAYRVAQRPLGLVVPHAKGAWRWPIVELQILDASLTATLGPKDSD
jgi:hypothetical protein